MFERAAILRIREYDTQLVRTSREAIRESRKLLRYSREKSACAAHRLDDREPCLIRRSDIERHLAQAEAAVALASSYVTRQGEILEQFSRRRNAQMVELTTTMLASFEESLLRRLEDREQIRLALAAAIEAERVAPTSYASPTNKGGSDGQRAETEQQGGQETQG
jgi:hypothetical protein